MQIQIASFQKHVRNFHECLLQFRSNKNSLQFFTKLPSSYLPVLISNDGINQLVGMVNVTVMKIHGLYQYVLKQGQGRLPKKDQKCPHDLTTQLVKSKKSI